MFVVAQFDGILFLRQCLRLLTELLPVDRRSDLAVVYECDHRTSMQPCAIALFHCGDCDGQMFARDGLVIDRAQPLAFRRLGAARAAEQVR